MTWMTWLQDAVFPRFCVHCKKYGDVLCARCWQAWVPVHCKRRKGRISLFAYTDKIGQKLLKAWKYDRDDQARLWLIRALERERTRIEMMMYSLGVEAIVPVPLHPIAHRLRGFNQATVLAEQLSEWTGPPVVQALRRRRYTSRQTKQDSHYWRRKSMNGDVFALHAELDARRILLVDDVWTTGSTMRAAAHVLKGSNENRQIHHWTVFGK